MNMVTLILNIQNQSTTRTKLQDRMRQHSIFVSPVCTRICHRRSKYSEPSELLPSHSQLGVKKSELLNYCPICRRPNHVLISVPGCVSDNRHQYDKADIPGKKSNDDTGNNQQCPNNTGGNIDKQRDTTNDHGSDRIRISIQH